MGKLFIPDSLFGIVIFLEGPYVQVHLGRLWPTSGCVHANIWRYFMQNHINVTIKSGAAWIVMNRPEVLNAIALHTSKQIAEAIENATVNPEVRVIVITGAGQHIFSAGADLNEVTKMMSSPDGAREFNHAFYRASRAVAACPKPTVARIQGHAIGGGLLLATACDLRIATARAKLGYPVSRLGVMLAPEGLYHLTKLVGVSRAKWMLFTAEGLSARQAEAWGLVDRVFDDESFEQEAERIISDIAKGAPLSIGVAKGMIDQIGRSGQVDDAFLQESYQKVFSSADLKEGFLAVREKRVPIFEGK